MLSITLLGEIIVGSICYSLWLWILGRIFKRPGPKTWRGFLFERSRTTYVSAALAMPTYFALSTWLLPPDYRVLWSLIAMVSCVMLLLASLARD